MSSLLNLIGCLSINRNDLFYACKLIKVENLLLTKFYTPTTSLLLRTEQSAQELIINNRMINSDYFFIF